MSERREDKIIERLHGEVDSADETIATLEGERERLLDALIEIDTYLASDPLVWRLGNVAKAGQVLCDVLGDETIEKINAEVLANCPYCDMVWGLSPREQK